MLRLSYVNSAFETGQRSPLDGAILEHGGVDTKGYELIEEVPFDFERKRVSVVVRQEGKALMITKARRRTCSRRPLHMSRTERSGRWTPERSMT